MICIEKTFIRTITAPAPLPLLEHHPLIWFFRCSYTFNHFSYFSTCHVFCNFYVLRLIGHIPICFAVLVIYRNKSFIIFCPNRHVTGISQNLCIFCDRIAIILCPSNLCKSWIFWFHFWECYANLLQCLTTFNFFLNLLYSFPLSTLI